MIDSYLTLGLRRLPYTLFDGQSTFEFCDFKN
jgi:hypothetical protein